MATPNLDWEMFATPMIIRANSVFHDGGCLLHYVVRYSPSSRQWAAKLEGSLLNQDSLQECIAACEEDNLRAVSELSASQLNNGEPRKA